MRIAIYVLIILVALMAVFCYALMVMAHDADERAEKMYKEWKNGKDIQSKDE